MTALQFIQDKRNSEDLISTIIHSTIQTLLDVNYPGLDANKLGRDQYKMLFDYVVESYNIQKCKFTGHYMAIPKQ
jgi:hypothetical protein